MNTDNVYQTYLKDCNCGNDGIIIYEGKAVCRWCRTPYTEDGSMFYLPESFLTSKQQPIKDYEIVQYGYIQNNENKPDERYIYSVKRSDGEVFSIEEITSEGRITGFTIDDRYIGGLRVDFENGLRGSYLASLKKVKQPLFTTSDGKDIFIDDELWIVSLDNFEILPDKARIMPIESWFENYLTFSTKLSAKNWVLENKPMFSIKEIREASQAKQNGFYWYDEAKLMHFAKQKLSL